MTVTGPVGVADAEDIVLVLERTLVEVELDVTAVEVELDETVVEAKLDETLFDVELGETVEEVTTMIVRLDKIWWDAVTYL